MTISPTGTPQKTQESAAAVVAGAYEAFAAGDVPAVLAALAEDISWHVGGRSPLAGDYIGHDGVLDFFGLLGELSNGTFRLKLHGVLDDGAEDVAVLNTEYAERNGRSGVFEAVHVWRVQDGLATRFEAFKADQYAVDAFYSS